MKPPNKQALEAAIQVALRSAQDENPEDGDRYMGLQASEAISIGRQISLCKITMNALRDHSLRLLADLKRRRNDIVSPLHALPNEVIADILLLTRHPKNPDLVRELESLTCVCRRWRSIVSTTPQFWDRITSFHSSKTAELFIRNSAALPLTIILQGHVYQRFVNVISPSSSRWRAVKSVESSPGAVNLLRHLPSTVEDLDISAPRKWSPHHGNMLHVELEGTTPLKHVKLQSVQVNWGSYRLSNLSSLHLSGMHLSGDRALFVIAASPGLETLHIHNILPIVTGSGSTPAHPLITLPNLLQFELQAVDAHFSLTLIRTLDLPNVRRLFIDHAPAHILSENNLPFFHSLKRLMGAVPEITITARASARVTNRVAVRSVRLGDSEEFCRNEEALGFYFGCRSGEGEISEHLKLASTFVSSVATTCPVVLSVGSEVEKEDEDKDQGDVDGHLHAVPLGVLRTLNMVTQISIGDNFDAQTVVDRLASSDELCPSLRTLDLPQTSRIKMKKYMKLRGGAVSGCIWTK